MASIKMSADYKTRYNTTSQKCECPARSFNPTMPCKHMIAEVNTELDQMGDRASAAMQRFESRCEQIMSPDFDALIPGFSDPRPVPALPVAPVAMPAPVQQPAPTAAADLQTVTVAAADLDALQAALSHLGPVEPLADAKARVLADPAAKLISELVKFGDAGLLAAAEPVAGRLGFNPIIIHIWVCEAQRKGA